jgi:hypothetical protein
MLNVTQQYRTRLVCELLRRNAVAVKLLAPGKRLRDSTTLAFLISSLLVFQNTFAHAQEFDLLLKNGQVIDPANNINAPLDIGIADGKIVKVAPDIQPQSAKKIVNVAGMYVCPGLIDIHTQMEF